MKESHSHTQAGADQEKRTSQIKRISEAYLYLLKMVLQLKERYREREYRKFLFFRSHFTQHQSSGQLCNFDRLQLIKAKQHKYIFHLSSIDF